MYFMSDNAAAVCPEVMAALTAANVKTPEAYDGDAWTRRLDGAFGELFGCPVRVFPVSTGSAANALILATMVPPWGAVVCERDAHIDVDECGAPEFFTGGAKLVLAPGHEGKLTPDAVAHAVAAFRGDVHQVQPGALSLTQATEQGTSYTPAEVAALCADAKARGWRTHMDGARFANAVAHLGCRPGDVTWRAGVDALAFGFIKNGGMSAEAIVLFDLSLADTLPFRRKRAGQLPSKGRFQAAQLLAMVESGAWLRNAQTANAGAQRLVGNRAAYPVQGNEVFLRLTAAEAAQLRAAGASFYDWGAPADGIARLVVSWDQPHGEIDRMAGLLADLA